MVEWSIFLLKFWIRSLTVEKSKYELKKLQSQSKAEEMLEYLLAYVHLVFSSLIYLRTGTMLSKMEILTDTNTKKTPLVTEIFFPYK